MPGEDCLYSNSNYILLGLIAEKVTGKTMKDLYQARIFLPLGLKSTYYDPDDQCSSGSLGATWIYLRGILNDTTIGFHADSTLARMSVSLTPNGWPVVSKRTINDPT